MFNVCYQCGAYHADKIIDPSGPVAICPACGHSHRFQQLPLLLIGGASGVGKSTICQRLVGQVTEAVLLDGDILWRDEFNTPEENYRAFFETWLRMAKNIGQSGRSVVIFGAGFVVPANVEACVERRYFSQIHYLGLVCEAEVLATRLRARPQWRQSSHESFVQGQIHFNQWILDQSRKHNSPVEVIDTTDTEPVETAEAVHRWIVQKLERG
jgi:2-phosphoglycerate kinase